MKRAANFWCATGNSQPVSAPLHPGTWIALLWTSVFPCDHATERDEKSYSTYTLSLSFFSRSTAKMWGPVGRPKMRAPREPLGALGPNVCAVVKVNRGEPSVMINATTRSAKRVRTRTRGACGNGHTSLSLHLDTAFTGLKYYSCKSALKFIIFLYRCYRTSSFTLTCWEGLKDFDLCSVTSS